MCSRGVCIVLASNIVENSRSVSSTLIRGHREIVVVKNTLSATAMCTAVSNHIKEVIDVQDEESESR